MSWRLDEMVSVPQGEPLPVADSGGGFRAPVILTGDGMTLDPLGVPRSTVRGR